MTGNERITDKLNRELAAAEANPPKHTNVVTDLYTHEPTEAKPWFTGLPFKTSWTVEEVELRPKTTYLANGEKMESPLDIAVEVKGLLGVPRFYRSRRAARRAMIRNAQPGKTYIIRRRFGLK